MSKDCTKLILIFLLGKNPVGSASFVIKTSPFPEAKCSVDPTEIIELETLVTVSCENLHDTVRSNFTLYAEDELLQKLRK